MDLIEGLRVNIKNRNIIYYSIVLIAVNDYEDIVVIKSRNNLEVNNINVNEYEELHYDENIEDYILNHPTKKFIVTESLFNDRGKDLLRDFYLG